MHHPIIKAYPSQPRNPRHNYTLFPLHLSSSSTSHLPSIFHQVFHKTIRKYDFSYTTFTKRIINHFINLNRTNTHYLRRRLTSALTIKYREMLIDISLLSNEFLTEFISKSKDDQVMRLMKILFYYATHIKVYPNYAVVTEVYKVIERNIVAKQRMINEKRVDDVLKELRKESYIQREEEVDPEDLSDADEDDYDEDNDEADPQERRARREKKEAQRKMMMNIMKNIIVANTEEDERRLDGKRGEIRKITGKVMGNNEEDSIGSVENLMRYIDNISLGYVSDSQGILRTPKKEEEEKGGGLLVQPKTRLQLHLQDRPISILNRDRNRDDKRKTHHKASFPSSLLTLTHYDNSNNEQRKVRRSASQCNHSISINTNDNTNVNVIVNTAKEKFAKTRAFINNLNRQSSMINQFTSSITTRIKSISLLKHSHNLQGLQLYKSGSSESLHNKTKQLSNRIFSLPTLIAHSKTIEADCKNAEKHKSLSQSKSREKDVALATTSPTTTRQQLTTERLKKRTRNEGNWFNRAAPKELKSLITKTFSMTKMQKFEVDHDGISERKSVSKKEKLWIMTNKILMHLKH